MPWYTQVKEYGRYRSYGYGVKGQIFLPSSELRVIGRVYEHKYDARLWANDDYGHKDMSVYTHEEIITGLEELDPHMEEVEKLLSETIDHFYRGEPRK